MAVGLNVGFYWYQIGAGDFLHCFFSTIAANLEDNEWGSKYSVIMNQLYQGELNSEDVDAALIELKTIKKEFSKLPPDRVVWDIENLDLLPPWGTNISREITNLSNYFVTSDGEDLFTVLIHALEKSLELNMPIKIESL